MSIIGVRNPQSGKSLQESAELLRIRRNILRGALSVASLMGTFLYFSGILPLVQQRAWLLVGIRSAVFAGLLIFTIFDKISYTIRAYGFLTLIFLLGVADLFQHGLEGDGRLFLLAFAILGMILFEFRTGMWIFTLGVITLILVGVLMILRILPLPIEPAAAPSGTITAWINGGIAFLTVVLIIITPLFSLVRGIEASMIQQKQAAMDLEQERKNLEKRIQERTDNLQLQARLLEISSTFAREISRLSELEDIIEYTGAFFHNRFGFENTAFYLIDSTNEFYILKAALGDRAAAIHQQLGRIRVGQPGTLSDLFGKVQVRSLQNTGDEAIYFKQAFLQDVPGAFVLPAHSLSQPVAGLFLYGPGVSVSSLQDLQLYQNIATQLGAAVEKARLFSETRRNLEELRASGRQQTQKTWRDYIKSSRRVFAYRFDRETMQTDVQPDETTIQAMMAGKPVITRSIENQGDQSVPKTTLAIPIVLRDQSFGAVEISFSGAAVPQDMITLVETTVKRLAVALENARLVEQIQQRAEREHTVGSITSKIREVSDIDSILKVAAAEIGQSLGAAEVSVQLRAGL